MDKAVRDIYLVTKNGLHADETMEHELISLNYVLQNVESPETFCASHEYVNRNIITQNSRLILKAASHPELKAFCFLINKN
jgi:hypothetical protein